ncbi:MAG TPA: nitroreductase/quinone reductase family protein [Ktedonobacteraceae bacterium]|jgi:hypothetical protein|nr:nitroreductase/quinone reductase family protein [Ktedonobacteraceae bacterium]
MFAELEKLGQEDFCYLTTTGRISGHAHTIEIWFALSSATLYMLAGDREKADWVKNIQHTATVTVKIGTSLYSGQGRLVKSPEEDALARQLVADKYVPRSEDDLTDWSRTALPVAIDITARD